MKSDPGKRRVTFTQEQMKATITLTLLHPNDIPERKLKPGEERPPSSAPPSVQQWRELAKEQFPGVHVEKEWQSIANGARALTFDMGYATGGVRQGLRVAYIAHRGQHCRVSGRFHGRIGVTRLRWLMADGHRPFSAQGCRGSRFVSTLFRGAVIESPFPCS